MRAVLTHCYIVCGLIVLALTPAHAQEERILDFHTNLLIQPDHSVIVEETIKAVTTGDYFERGIVRDLPTYMRLQSGMRHATGVKILNFTRDGNPEVYQTEYLPTDMRIHAGGMYGRLTPGTYTYTLLYQLSPPFDALDTHDELIWNATGQKWGVPIEQASATVYFPVNSVKRDQLAGQGMITGHSRDKLVAEINEKNEVAFQAKTPLRAGDKLMISVQFPKELLQPVSAEEHSRQLQAENTPLMLGLIAVIVTVLGYVCICVVLGIRGKARAQTTPPMGISPASARYVRTGMADGRIFVAALTNMAAKGVLTFARGEQGLSIQRKNIVPKIALTPEEEVIAGHLLGYESSYTFRTEPAAAQDNVLAAMTTALKAQRARLPFVQNRLTLALGIALSAIMLFFICYRISLRDMGNCDSGVRASLFFGTALAAGGVWALLLVLGYAGRKGAGWRGAMSPLGYAISLLLLLAGGAAGVYLLWQNSLDMLAIVVALGLIHLIFAHLLKAAQRSEQRILAELASFRDYLTDTTEGQTAQYLPYAIALDADEWLARFPETDAKENILSVEEMHSLIAILDEKTPAPVG